MLMLFFHNYGVRLTQLYIFRTLSPPCLIFLQNYDIKNYRTMKFNITTNSKLGVLYKDVVASRHMLCTLILFVIF